MEALVCYDFDPDGKRPVLKWARGRNYLQITSSEAKHELHLNGFHLLAFDICLLPPRSFLSGFAALITIVMAVQ